MWIFTKLKYSVKADCMRFLKLKLSKINEVNVKGSNSGKMSTIQNTVYNQKIT